jgi:hypothetical protein
MAAVRERTYAEVADKVGVTLCEKAFGSCAKLDHEVGTATATSGPVVHWRRKRMTRPGLRHFLMLVAEARFYRCRWGPRWLLIYHRNVTACMLAKALRTRLDQRHLSITDRAKVRFMLDHLDPRDFSSEAYRDILPRVRGWTQRFPAHR